LLESVVLVTLTVTATDDVTEGALKAPVFDTVPALAVQLTELLLALFIRAVNCTVSPLVTVALAGEMAMVKLELLGSGVEVWLGLETAPLTPEQDELNTTVRAKKRLATMLLLRRLKLLRD
jgi:hypothetical protein